MDEFEIIRRYFNRDTQLSGVVVGIGDDGAVLAADCSKQQVQVIDTLIEGVHFPSATNPADIAYRAVAVNLSDVAAMGAVPRWMTLALTLENASEQWLQEFASGLFAAADEHKVALVGGDTTRGSAVTVTVSITGEVNEGAALLRSGAKVGDGIFVTGTLGDAAAGLQMLLHSKSDGFLASRFLRPTPRVDIGRAIIGKASAAIDLSDGLLGDLSKLLIASGVGGELEIDSLPLSDELRSGFAVTAQHQFALSGGDDYELCFTASANDVSDIADVTLVGRVTETAGLICRLHGDIVEMHDSGYRHFQ